MMMREQSPRVTVLNSGDVTIVELGDKKILDELNIAKIGDELNSLAAKAAKPRMIIDFVNVAHMSSSALGMLITLHKHVREKSGQLCFCNIQPAIYEVFVITRLNEIFQIRQSRDEAMGYIQCLPQ